MAMGRTSVDAHFQLVTNRMRDRVRGVAMIFLSRGVEAAVSDGVDPEWPHI
jgi:hypothetical protein